MSLSGIFQLAFNIFMLTGFSILWMRYRKTEGDDPRMSRSLQLMQSKISILEDLSDRIDEQLTQATTLMEHKRKEVDSKIADADRTLHAIQNSRDKSLEVAKIFQDRIPHQEIIERQRTVEYVKAARLAHQGVNVDEIVQQVNLPAGEVELIAKMNREQLQFSLEDLPDWAVNGENAATSVASSSPSPILEMPKPEAAPSKTGTRAHMAAESHIQNELAEIGERLRMASQTTPEAKTVAIAVENPVEEAPVLKPKAPSTPPFTTTTRRGVVVTPTSGGVQRIVFPKIEVTQHLS